MDYYAPADRKTQQRKMAGVSGKLNAHIPFTQSISAAC